MTAARPAPYCAAVLAFTVPAWAQDDAGAARERMIGDIEAHAERAPGVAEEGIDPAVLQAMREVPRHEFVPEEVQEYAYEDRPDCEA